MSKQPNHPQRLTPTAAPGALLKRLHGVAQRVRLREVTGTDETYLALVRQCPCLHCGLDPCGEAAHVRMQSGAHNKHGGMAQKPADKWALPLCPEDHRLNNDAQHALGERQFWSDLGIDPLLACERLWRARGDLVAMRAVIYTTVAERESATQWQRDTQTGDE